MDFVHSSAINYYPDREKILDNFETPLDLSCHNRKRVATASYATSPNKLKSFSNLSAPSTHNGSTKNFAKDPSNEDEKKNTMLEESFLSNQASCGISQKCNDKALKPFQNQINHLFPPDTPVFSDVHSSRPIHAKQSHTHRLPLPAEVKDFSYPPNFLLDFQTSNCHSESNLLHLSILKLLENQNQSLNFGHKPFSSLSTAALLQQLSLQNSHFHLQQLWNRSFFPKSLEHSIPLVKSIPTNRKQGITDEASLLHKNTEISNNSAVGENVGYSALRSFLQQKEVAKYQGLPSLVNDESKKDVRFYPEVFSTNGRQSGISEYSQVKTHENFAKERERSCNHSYLVQSQSSKETINGIQKATYKISNPKLPRPVNFKPCKINCGICGRTYATEGALAKHMKMHEDPQGENTFKCKICKKACSTLGALRMHIRTHTLPCECHICGKAFSRTWLLQGHIRTHTGEKPYQCTKCSRAFADRSNLRAHMQTHESIKRYSCRGCEKTFSRISLLKRHQRHCNTSESQQAVKTNPIVFPNLNNKELENNPTPLKYLSATPEKLT